MKITIRNINDAYGMRVTETGETLQEAIATMQTAIRACGPEFANVVVTDDDYEIVDESTD